MGENEYNKELCDERHKNIDYAFQRLFKNVEELSKMWGRFLLVTIATLLGVVLNILLTLVEGGL